MILTGLGPVAHILGLDDGGLLRAATALPTSTERRRRTVMIFMPPWQFAGSLRMRRHGSLLAPLFAAQSGAIGDREVPWRPASQRTSLPPTISFDSLAPRPVPGGGGDVPGPEGSEAAATSEVLLCRR